MSHLYMHPSVSTMPFCSHAHLRPEDWQQGVHFSPIYSQYMQWHHVHSQNRIKFSHMAGPEKMCREFALCTCSVVFCNYLIYIKVKATFPLTRCTLVSEGLQSRRGQFIHKFTGQQRWLLGCSCDQSYGSAWVTSMTHHTQYALKICGSYFNEGHCLYQK